jgi:hypothetical protein
MAEQVPRDVLVAESLGEGVRLVEEAPHRDVPLVRPLVADVVEVSEGVGVLQRAVLVELLPARGPLDPVQRDEAAEVGAREEVAGGVEVEPPHVPPAVAEELELAGNRMIPPDALLERLAFDMGGHRAPLQAVEPAVRPPRQRVRHRMCILHAESRQTDLGIAVGYVVAVAVGIEEKIRDLEDEHAAMAERQPARQVQAVDEVPGGIRPAVSVLVLEDRDPIRAPRPPRRRGRDRVVDGPRVAIHLHPLQAGRVGVLQVLDDPQPAPVVELDGDRLADHRLAREGHDP